MSKNNKKIREHADQGAKIVFGDSTMCAQFLDGYIPIECLKGLKPEQIEDMSERFVSMWDSERDSDVVKKIHLSEDSDVYLIAIIEHQSKVDYTTPMKLLRYMLMIWTDYEKEMEKQKSGITKVKDFQYPPILPLIYFEGTGKWTAATNLMERIALSDIFKDYIPDFRYEVVRVHDYTDDEIISKGNELSVIMLINKLKNSEDIKKLQNLPKEEIADFTDRILERRVPMFFESFEAYDVQETRRVSREEGKIEDIFDLLSDLGEIPETLKKRIREVKDLEMLRVWHKKAANAESIEQFCEQIG